MAKPRTTKARKATRKIRDLAVKSAAGARVKGGGISIPYTKIEWDYKSQ